MAGSGGSGCWSGGGAVPWRWPSVARVWLFIVGREGARSAVSWLLGCSRGQMRREIPATGRRVRITDVPKSATRVRLSFAHGPLTICTLHELFCC
jgi:hypothetical protein